MSNHLAIMTVTETLKQFLQTEVVKDVDSVIVTSKRPKIPSANSDPEVNIYLYQIMPNTAWRNADLPSRRSDTTLIQRPQIALDLFYILTFYGNDDNNEPQKLLGSVVKVLHAKPLLILNGQVESIKLSLLPLNLEELSKLWSVFFQIPYSLSVAYQASVVLIESDEEVPRPALPVRDRNLYVVPFHQPIIEQVISQNGIDQPIIANSAISIRGQRLRSDTTKVRINGIEITPEEVTDTKITLTLPINLRAGVLGLQVIHQLLIGTPPVMHPGVQFESNVAAFVLHPKIKGVEKINLTSIKVTFNPKVGRKQRVVLLLNEVNPPPERQAYAYSFNAPTNNGITDENTKDTDIIIFSIKSVNSAEYLIRVQVDGAESPLEWDENTKKYNKPSITI